MNPVGAVGARVETELAEGTSRTLVSAAEAPTARADNTAKGARLFVACSRIRGFLVFCAPAWLQDAGSVASIGCQ